MKVTTTNILCDVCRTKLREPHAFTNCGKYQQTYVSFGETDMCFTCAGKMYDLQTKSIEGNENLIAKLKDLLGYSGTPIDSVKIDGIDFQLQTFFNGDVIKEVETFGKFRPLNGDSNASG